MTQDSSQIQAHDPEVALGMFYIASEVLSPPGERAS